MRLLLSLLLAFPFAVWAETVTLNWTAPTERTDGTPLSQSEIGGYTLRKDGELVDATIQGTATSYSLTLGPGEHCFDMATTDTEGRTGPFGVVVCRSIKAVPGAPTDLIINIAP